MKEKHETTIHQFCIAVGALVIFSLMSSAISMWRHTDTLMEFMSEQKKEMHDLRTDLKRCIKRDEFNDFKADNDRTQTYMFNLISQKK